MLRVRAQKGCVRKHSVCTGSVQVWQAHAQKLSAQSPVLPPEGRKKHAYGIDTGDMAGRRIRREVSCSLQQGYPLHPFLLGGMHDRQCSGFIYQF